MCYLFSQQQKSMETKYRKTWTPNPASCLIMYHTCSSLPNYNIIVTCTWKYIFKALFYIFNFFLYMDENKKGPITYYIVVFLLCRQPNWCHCHTILFSIDPKVTTTNSTLTHKVMANSYLRDYPGFVLPLLKFHHSNNAWAQPKVDNMNLNPNVFWKLLWFYNNLVISVNQTKWRIH